MNHLIFNKVGNFFYKIYFNIDEISISFLGIHFGLVIIRFENVFVDFDDFEGFSRLSFLDQKGQKYLIIHQNLLIKYP